MNHPMKAIIILTSLAAALTGVATHANHDTNVEHTSTLTLQGAKKVGDAAEALADRLGAGGAIAVVDAGGHLLYLVRRSGTFLGSPEISIGKARTAAEFKKPTRDFEEIIAKGRFAMTALPNFTPLQGGVPIYQGGNLVGAVGVSGAKSAAQDEEIAIAGAAVFANAKP